MKKHYSPIYRSILDLPLIKGVSAARLTEIAGRYHLNFIKYKPAETIIRAGEPCESLKFVLSGDVRVTITDPEQLLTVSQTLSAPQVISPDNLFGRLTDYPCTVKAESPVGIMEISKEEYRLMLAADSVFLFNYLNSVCSTSQRSTHWLTALTSGNAIKRIAYWIGTLTQSGGSDIVVKSEKSDLHSIFGIQPAAWRSAIERLTEAGIITEASPRLLRVPARAPLVALLN